MMKGKVKIAIRSGKFMEVDGDIYGIVAVTPGKYKSEVITHIASGYAMTPAILQKKKIRKLAILINQHSECFTKLSTKRKTKRNKEAADILHSLWLQCDLSPYW
jgi:hypothetical protein